MMVSAISRTVVANGHAELPGQMLAEALRRRDKLIEGGFLDDLMLAAAPSLLPLSRY
jgi:hypothetical protein